MASRGSWNDSDHDDEKQEAEKGSLKLSSQPEMVSGSNTVEEDEESLFIAQCRLFQKSLREDRGYNDLHIVDATVAVTGNKYLRDSIQRRYPFIETSCAASIVAGWIRWSCIAT